MHTLRMKEQTLGMRSRADLTKDLQIKFFLFSYMKRYQFNIFIYVTHATTYKSLFYFDKYDFTLTFC